ncbi:hypothetical protein NLI96_g366 [Meripilus lineatus]|uniref:Uncharacterized protein n=1 Tax=Meripilus lineatus TaxID=2056292 RepID=A0AAD5VCT2_9APHY|nr:hypothetical protein NLI96_g366 [Physisporinus lineatus]
MSPSFKTQVQGMERRVPRETFPAPPDPRPKGSKGREGFECCLSELSQSGNPSKPTKGKGRRGYRQRTKSKQRKRSESSDGESGESGSGSNPSPGSGTGSGSELEGVAIVRDYEKRWDARRRDPRVNGADIYVARFTKHGMGSARPCWRCLEWSRWAGIKRIFHWNDEEGRFEVVKVNSANLAHYETHADVRLFAGLVGNPLLHLLLHRRSTTF